MTIIIFEWFEMTDTYQQRTYRQLVHGHLPGVRVTVQETDLGIYARHLDPGLVRQAVIETRGLIEGYIHRYPDFCQSLHPWPDDPLAPPIVRKMIQAGRRARVGPMAAVAGAVAEQVGRSALAHTEEVIIENGGDIFMAVQQVSTIGIFAGRSPLSLKVGLKINPLDMPLSVCTSSGTVGHSKSFGNADAVCVLSRSCALADAGATSIANQVTSVDDIDTAIQWAREIEGVMGVLIIIGEKMGLWGQMELTALPAGSEGEL